ncbi:MAG: MFS transporter [Candidatus Geothermarchaeales archaeon]
MKLKDLAEYLGETKGRSFIYLSLTHALIHIFTLMHVALIPVFMDEFGLSTFQAGLLVTVPLITQLLVNIPGGLLSDRLGHRPLMALSLLAGGASSILVSRTTDIYGLVISLSLLAASLSLYHPPSLSVTSELFSERHRGKAFGIHGAGGTLGVALGPISLGLLMVDLGWRTLYLLWAIPVFFSVLPLTRVEVPHQMSQNFEAPMEQSDKSIGSLMITVNFMLLLLVIGVWWMGVRSVSTFMTTYLVAEKSLSKSEASLIFGLSPLVGVFGNSSGGFLSDRLGEKEWMTIAYAMGFVALSAVAFSPFMWMLILSYLLYGFFRFTSRAATASLVARFTPTVHRGLAYGVFFTPIKLVEAFAPILAAWIIEAYSIWHIFPFALIAFFSCILLIQLMSTPKD